MEESQFALVRSRRVAVLGWSLRVRVLVEKKKRRDTGERSLQWRVLGRVDVPARMTPTTAEQS